MHNADLVAANGLSVLESEAQDALRGVAGDELNALDNTVNDHVLDTGVLSLGVLADQHSVDVVPGSLVALNRLARAQVGEKVKCAAQSQVERDVALANGGLDTLTRRYISSRRLDVRRGDPSRRRSSW